MRTRCSATNRSTLPAAGSRPTSTSTASARPSSAPTCPPARRTRRGRTRSGASSTRWQCGCRSSEPTTPLAVVTGDLNVGHRELDIRNWKGNVKKAGFLPRERAYFDRFLGEAGARVAARRRLGRPRTRLGRRRPPLPRRGRRPVHLVVEPRQGVRQRHRLAHRLPPRHAGARRRASPTTASCAPRRGTRAGAITLRSSSTTRSAAEPARRARRRAGIRSPVGLSGEQTAPVLRHAALGRLPPGRQLHRGAHAVARPAGGLRRVLLGGRPARPDAAERPGRAAREDPPHGRAVHRRRHRAVEVDAVRAVARARARRARVDPLDDHRASARPGA